MDIKITLQKRHLLYLIITLAILTGINYSIAQTPAPPNPGHPADEISGGTISGDVAISGDLRVSGDTKTDAILVVDDSEPTTYEVSSKKYIFEAR